MDLEIRKENIKNIIVKKNTAENIALKLLKDSYLDETIKRINDKKTNITNKKIYLTGDEQFINILKKFINYFLTELNIEETDAYLYLSHLLENKSPKFLLCKNHTEDNNFITYYKFNMKKLLIENFYTNIKLIYNDYKLFFKEKNITNTMSLKNSNTINKLYTLLKEIISCNKNQESIIFLFSNFKNLVEKTKNITNKTIDEINNYIHNSYKHQYSILINEYKKGIDKMNNELN